MPNLPAPTTYFKDLLLNTRRNSKGREGGREWEPGEKRRYWQTLGKTSLCHAWSRGAAILASWVWPRRLVVALDCHSKCNSVKGLLFRHLAEGFWEQKRWKPTQHRGPFGLVMWPFPAPHLPTTWSSQIRPWAQRYFPPLACSGPQILSGLSYAFNNTAFF